MIGVAYVPTPEGREALAAAAALARAGGVKLRVITVAEEDHAADQSHGLMASQHHEVSAQEETAERRRVSAESGLADVVAEIASGVECDIDVLVNDPAAGPDRRVAFRRPAGHGLARTRSEARRAARQRVAQGRRPRRVPAAGPPARGQRQARRAARRRRGTGEPALTPTIGLLAGPPPGRPPASHSRARLRRSRTCWSASTGSGPRSDRASIESWAVAERQVVPPWAQRRDLWERAFAAIRGGPPVYCGSFLHRDFHPGNVLFDGDAVSGVVDWVETSWGPTELDVSHCSTALALLHGPPRANSSARTIETPAARSPTSPTGRSSTPSDTCRIPRRSQPPGATRGDRTSAHHLLACAWRRTSHEFWIGRWVPLDHAA